MIAAGTKLGRYEIRSLLGAGGMGEVYLAEDTQLGRRVAIKFLSPEWVTDERANKRLVKEARAAATLDHPNICSIYEVGEADGRSFIAMQYLEGKTLDARSKSNPLKLKESLTFAAQIADALAEAHSHSIIHRDIKPANIMITSRGQAKIMDFGLARLIAGAIETEAATQSLLTTPGTVMGTMPYMSPEQVRGEVLDGRSDIFSFGVMLYEMLSGRRPFANASAAATISAILNEEPPALWRYAPDLPEELQRIARKCLEKDRERRYQTMRDVAIDLDNCRREHETAPATVSQRDQVTADETVIEVASDLRPPKFLTSRRAIIAGALLALLVAAVFVYVLVFRRSATTERPTEIKSLAVLPLKSLDAGENYLGLGIADAVISRMNQTGKVIVRPTSAVRRYLNEDTDALTAARQLNADAVLEGSVQRDGDRLRVSVNLLRTTDGFSLWTDHFDMRMTDIFTIQDTVAQQVASRLQLQLDPSQQARLTRRYTSNPIAYEFYVRGFFNMNPRDRNKQQQQEAIDFFEQAIAADPNFALAHAQLSYTYAVNAIFIEPTEPLWVERAREEINRAQTLDPQLAETHLSRSLLLYSGYEGYQTEPAIHELLLGQQLNPNLAHVEIGSLYSHIGLENLAARELQRALEIDPTSQFARDMNEYQYQMSGRYDEWLAAHQKLYGNERISAWYFLGKGRLEEAQKAIGERSAKQPDDLEVPRQQALLVALKGDLKSAEALIPAILSRHPLKDLNYHHAAYDIACIYALEGKTEEAVKWLRAAAATGFPCYPLFERDAYLNRIRQAPEFIQFMAEMKAQNERYRREFGEGAT